jgi:hypothetical protein
MSISKRPAYGRPSHSHFWELVVIAALVALLVAIVVSL